LIITANPILITGSILFAVLFGLLAGFLPAQDAMKKQIVEVLRKK
jgi:ABC-type lipoprotein release transport system permease subunit